MNLKLILLLTCGIFWTIAYIDMIRVGVKHKTYSMPFIALSLNFSWEIYNTIQGYAYAGFHVTTIINCFWVLFDIGILSTYFKYGMASLNISKVLFYSFSISVILISFVFHHALAAQQGSVMGALYSGFWINLIMSVLFIRMFYNRAPMHGQTILIALTKCIGTLAVTILVGVVGINALGGVIVSIAYVGFITFIIDLWYIYLVVTSTRKKTLQVI